MWTFRIQEKTGQVSDGLGGLIDEWADKVTVNGWIDMLTGSDYANTDQNALIEQSTHVMIIPVYTPGITKNMRVLDLDDRWYKITYSDNPVGANHHNELYLTYEGVLDE